jgi:hypothetical protein
VAGKSIRGRPLEIVRFASSSELSESTCHLLFISLLERKTRRELTLDLADQCILTVSDFRNPSRLGSMIRMDVINDRIRFDIDLKAATAADLKISSKLLKVARAVKR